MNEKSNKCTKNLKPEFYNLIEQNAAKKIKLQNKMQIRKTQKTSK